MSEKTFRTRIKLRYDTLQGWTDTNPVLLTGETAVTVIPPAEAGKSPSVLLKIGDGVHNYLDLPYITAKAGDVYDWAKQENKPTYKADEIEGLADFINGEIEDTNTKYQIVPGSTDPDNKTFILQSQEKGETTWTDVYTLTIPEDISYTLSSDQAGELTFTPSKGDVQKIQIVEIETDSTKISADNDKLPTAGAVADYVDGLLTDLNVEDAAVTGEFVTEVKQTDGKIEVKRQKLVMTDISDLKTNSVYDEEKNKLATMSDIKSALTGIYNLKGVVAKVSDLPTEGNEVGDTYHVKSNKGEYYWCEKTDDEGNVYYEWEDMGKLMDMSAYYTKDDVDGLLDTKQDLITETNKLSVDLVNGTATDEKDGLMSAEDKAKLDTLEENSQENVIEKIIAGDTLLPIEEKTVTLAKIAETGNVMDLIQDDDNWLILDGGNAIGAVPIEPSTLILNGGTSIHQ